MASQSGGGGGFTPNTLAVNCGTLTVPAGSFGTPIPVTSIAKAGSAYHPVVGQSQIGITLPGWFEVVVFVNGGSVPSNTAEFHLDEGSNMSFADGNPPEDWKQATPIGHAFLQSTGYLRFDGVAKTLEMGISNPGASDITCFPYIMASYLGPA